MDLKKKNVLVMGMGISGLSNVQALDKLGANIIINDIKTQEELKDELILIKDIVFDKYLGGKEPDLRYIDLILKSPGIRPDNKILSRARKKDIMITNDIEIGSSFSSSKNIIAITGTNGKTTTTRLMDDILKNSGYNTFTGGNIGKSIIMDMLNAKKEDVFILETSSFQLENIINFKPKISLILNISQDHIDWHGSYENYINAKKKIFKNQDKDDYTILNYDDNLLRSFEGEINSNIIWFSVNTRLDRGIFVEDGKIIINLDGTPIEFIATDKLLLKGKHNLENILGGLAIAIAMGVPIEKTKVAIKEFKGVEHRLEFVVEKNGVKFYNDSKGTNISSSLKAIEAIEDPIILIAGGYDKKIEFDELIDGFNGKDIRMILLGGTSNKIKKSAIKHDFNNYYLAKDMKEAVDLAYRLSRRGDSILLSPACASWDMFKNFEERGRIFKQMVYDLGEE